jgi:ADP-heptose:LPS heptosyltransferase
MPLPPEYAAVKFYRARSLPDQPAVRDQLRALVDSLSERMPVVHLDTGLGLDDHADYTLNSHDRVLSVSGRLDARSNLAVQTRIVAGARVFVGTCGSLAWLAPLLGVPTVPIFSDASFLHSHLHVARRVYGRAGAAAFSPIDLTGIMDAGLAIGSQRAGAASGRAPDGDS